MAQYNECQLAYYQANGATSGDLNDAEMEFLLSQGQPQASINDMWFGYLRLQGYVGARPDMRDQFWIDNGCQPD